MKSNQMQCMRYVISIKWEKSVKEKHPNVCGFSMNSDQCT